MPVNNIILYTLGGLLIFLGLMYIYLDKVFLKIFLDPPEVLRHVKDFNPAHFKIPFERFEVKSVGNVKISGWFIKNKNAQKTIVVTHGILSSKYFFLPRSVYFYVLGYNVCLFDLRSHGKSGGEKPSYGLYEQEDLKAVVKYIKAKKDIPPQKLALVAHSMGAATGTIYCSKYKDFSAFVCISCYYAFKHDIKYWVGHTARLPSFIFAPIGFHIIRKHLRVPLQELDPSERVSHLNCPVFFIHGDQDPLTHYTSSEMLYAQASEPKELWIISGFKHKNFYETAGHQFERRVAKFLEKYL